MSERLSPLDASFLYLEKPHLHMHVGGLAVFDPTGVARGPLTLDRLRAMTAARLQMVPRFRQRVMFPPLEAARPVWADDPGFDVTYHVRRIAVPRPGGPRQLAALTGQLASQQLDRERPLWEMYLVDGLEGGYQAVLTKTHHAMLDGVGGMDAVAALFDLAPEPDEPAAQRWDPEPLPSSYRLLAEGLLDRIREPAGALASTAADLARRPTATLRDIVATAGGALSILARGLPPDTPFNVAVGATRRFAMTAIPLEEARAVQASLGGTVNDVILTALAGGVSALLEARGQAGKGLRYRTMMPISVRTGSEHGAFGNRVTTVYPDIPVGPMKPVVRLRLVREETRRIKSSRQGQAATALVQGAMWLPPGLHRRLGRFGNDHLRIFNMVASNIPGPQVPLYLDGARLVTYYPLMPLGARVGLSVGVVTLVGVMGFGFTADWEAFPDLELLALEVEDAFGALQKAAGV
ncbi:MAG TPA: wax ester/triacylglycerol synthase family O-acyltransferase [Actinomycetota bacterium]|nr:wax ester/triacylglycerol synthase family O-acyltransferase [Actinomycetota bacterium]